MNRITFLRVVRAIEREAAFRGYHGDIFVDCDDVPLVGTRQQQMAIMTIAADTKPRGMSTRDRELHNRLVRAAVLAEPSPYTLPPRQPVAQRRRRAW